MHRNAWYPGWRNLGIAALAMVATLPGRTQGLGLVTEPLLADLGLDRVAFASLNFWATLLGASFCLPVGWLTDRLGARRLLALMAVALGLTVVGMSRASTGFWTLAVFVTLTRGLGQSALSVVSLAHVGKWFARRLPMAMGIYALLVSIGFIAAFPSVGAAVLAYGWRASWQGVGLALLAVFLPLVWLFASNADAAAGSTEDLGAQPEDLTFAEALATPSFWVFGLASAAFGLVYSGIALFNESILAQRGFPPAVYHQTLVVSTMLGLVANFAGGWLAPRWSLQRLMAVGMAALAVSLAALPHVATMAHVMLWAAAMGIAGGIVTVVFFSVWSQVFGRAHLGRIQGAAQMLTVFASATGPVLLASTLARDGTYDTVFRALGVFVVLLAAACWVVPLPQRTAPALQGAMAQ